MSSVSNLALFGCGKMGMAYAKVLAALHPDYTAVGHSAEGVARFQKATGHPAVEGGWEAYLQGIEPGRLEAAIVALPVPDLESATFRLMELGVRRILLEKPGALDPAGIKRLADAAEAKQCDIRVAYNRRFYSSVATAREMIREDGGAVSFHFEFTEIPDRVAAHIKDAPTLSAWYFANSTHVVDLAFHLCGTPVELDGITEGGLAWHPAGSRFVGHGRTGTGALFTYHANWDSPGSWCVEIATSARKFVFRPIERLLVQKSGEFRPEAVDVDGANLDKTFKPGVYRQVNAFLSGNAELRWLPSVEEQAGRLTSLLAPSFGKLVAVR